MFSFFIHDQEDAQKMTGKQPSRKTCTGSRELSYEIYDINVGLNI